MDFSRRSFIQLLGIGTAGTLVNPIVAPLFGSDEVEGKSLLTSGDSPLGYHLVYSLGSPGSWEPARNVTADMQREMFFEVRRPSNLNHYQGPSEMVVTPPPYEMDPHAAFYKTALEVRRRFAEKSYELLFARSPDFRKRARLVTRIYSEIYARPKGTMSPSPEEELQGFEVVAEYETMLVFGDVELPKTAHVYSKTGDYPISIPSKIEMSLLMKLDREILADPERASRRGFFRRWKP